ncbi:MAG TPA: response regulator [Gemmatimonadales bacterium]|nr:response regulator [Gemmatimonadales bacterium]
MTHRERERRQRERDDLFRQLVELAPDALLIHHGERIVFANSAAVQLAGAPDRDALVGQPISRFLDPPYLKAVRAELVEGADPAELAAPVRDRFRRLDGTVVDVEVRALAFMDDAQLSVHLVIRDITDRLGAEAAVRRAEQHLQHAQRIESVGALAGGVAHEVNNMMTVILGFSEFLLQQPGLGADRLAEVREIAKAAQHATAVTQQLLAFSRRSFYQPRPVDLDAAVHSLEPVIRRLLGEARRLVITSRDQPWVVADPGQLEQVIVNLALNARDAMPAGGELAIDTAETELPSAAAAADGGEIPPGHYAALTVRDSGTGMDAATRARMFEPFFTTKPFGQGTGLGLAAVYGIITQNQGHIGLTSAPGQGSAFTLYLPAVPRPATTEARPGRARSVDAPRPGGTILVAEDDAAVRAIIARSLAQRGFQVLEACDGGDALEVVERLGPPDLVLTDLMMPRIGGAELARGLRQRWPALPILFMSGYSAEQLREDRPAGFEGAVLQKPFTPEALIRQIDAALAHKSRLG